MTAIKNLKKFESYNNSFKLNFAWDLIIFASNFYEWDLCIDGNTKDGFDISRVEQKIGSTILFELMKICDVCHTNLVIKNENCVSIY
jgi:hypothetical protein